MSKATYSFLLVLFLLALAALACVGGVDNGSSGSISGVGSESSHLSISAMATATFGAEQFHAQLTAIAEQKTP